jgi:hypothetical protein
VRPYERAGGGLQPPAYNQGIETPNPPFVLSLSKDASPVQSDEKPALDGRRLYCTPA